VEVVHITKLKPYKEPFDLEKVSPSGDTKIKRVQWDTKDTLVEDKSDTLDLEDFEENMDLDEDLELEQEFEVEQILQQRKRKGRNQYLVKWSGYDEPTWESEDKLEHLDALKEFKAAHRPYYSLRRVNKD